MNAATVFFAVAFCANFLLIAILTLGAYRHNRREKQLKATESSIVNRSEQMLNQANQKAIQTVIQAETFKKQLETEIQTAVTQAMQLYTTELTKNTKTILNSYIEVANQVKTDIVQDAQKTLTELRTIGQAEQLEFKATLQQEEQAATSFLKTKLQQQLERAETELDQFKQLRQTQIQKDSEELIKQIVKQVLPQTISFDEHHALIIEALKKAQTDGVIK